MFKVSVIMASYLYEYENSATDRVRKFHRAVNSFIKNNYPLKELIIVSDGCNLTEHEYNIHYKNNSDIKFIKIDKQPIFSGNVRNIGCSNATGEIICYLDTDDYIGSNHLQYISNAFSLNNTLSWVYYNDRIVYQTHPITNEPITIADRSCLLESGSIGTSNIAHLRNSDTNWNGCDGYGHDWIFIKEKLIPKNYNYQKINLAEYYVCHIPNSVNS